MKNDYEIRGDVTAIILKSPTYGVMETLISTNKLKRVSEFPNRWHPLFDKDTDSYYVYGNLRAGKEKRKKVLLHRWVIDVPQNLYVDHIDHDTLNNLDSNLRVLTNAENQQNRKGPTKNSKSGIRGVSWHEPSKKWRVQIKLNKKVHVIGCFDSINEAEAAAIDARKKYMPFSQDA